VFNFLPVPADQKFMKSWFCLAFLLLLSSCAATADRLPSSEIVPEKDCRNPLDTNEPVKLRSDFPFKQTPAEMRELFERQLREGKRFEYRGYREGGKYIVPIFPGNRIGLRNPSALVHFPRRVVRAVVEHMQEAFKRGYANYPFHSDMGHGHLLLPSEEARRIKERSDREGLNRGKEIELYLQSRSLKILYHAAEQLKYAENGRVVPELEFLRKHRNIIGSIADPRRIVTVDVGGVPNTAGAPEGMAAVGIFWMGAARRGCIPFPYRGEELFLDISLVGPSYDPALLRDDDE
jgi:hypothetical protein